MKTYLSEIVPKLKRHSKKLDNTALFVKSGWNIIDDTGIKSSFFFQSDNRLIISKNGKAEVERWELLNNDTVLISIQGSHFLFKHAFVDKEALILQLDGKPEFVFFVSESQNLDKHFSIEKISERLERKYLVPVNKEFRPEKSQEEKYRSDRRKEQRKREIERAKEQGRQDAEEIMGIGKRLLVLIGFALLTVVVLVLITLWIWIPIFLQE